MSDQFLLDGGCSRPGDNEGDADMLDDEIRKCCREVEGMEREVQRLRVQGGDEAKQSLSRFDAKWQRFVHEVHETSERWNAGARQGLDHIVGSWRGVYDSLRAHLRVVEAKGFLMSARRLTGQEEFVAAENELESAVQDFKEAQSLLPEQDTHLRELVGDIETAVTEIRGKAATATERIERVLARATHLVEELDSRT